ncbi:MAG: T9SS type A sorting domain-containing protein [Bacteroidota bacterium]
MKKHFYILLFWFSCYTQVNAQCNLVPNPSFEIDTNCFNGGLGIENGEVLPWNTPTNTTPDMWQTCANGVMGNPVPLTYFGYQQTHSGNNFAGIATFIPSTPNFREYLQVQLDSALVLNRAYCVSFYVNLPNIGGLATNNMGLYFSDTYTLMNFDVLPFIPQINYTSIITDTMNWTEISGTYIAHGGEQYIILGNFYADSLTDTIGFQTIVASNNRFGYYFVDDVDVHPCACNVGVKEETESKSITLSPNPFTSQTTLSFGEQQTNTTVIITNLLGEEIKTIPCMHTKQLVIDKGEMKSGIYFVQTIDDAKRISNKKMVVE